MKNLEGERHSIIFKIWKKEIQFQVLHGDTNFGSGPGVSDKLFVSEPLSAIQAELKIETGHKGAKHTTPLC